LRQKWGQSGQNSPPRRSHIRNRRKKTALGEASFAIQARPKNTKMHLTTRKHSQTRIFCNFINLSHTADMLGNGKVLLVITLYCSHNEIATKKGI
jgi:hypothetical protein